MEKLLDNILKNETPFRRRQIYEAWFKPQISSLAEVTTLPKDFREKHSDYPWQPCKLLGFHESKVDDTKKALLGLRDGLSIETVLMGRVSKKQVPKDEKRYTVCLSSQVGCPLKCCFCATGKIGFRRNLTAEEIIGQFRFWNNWLAGNSKGKISNIVLMGQGEPLLNYDAVKEAINIFIRYAGIGPSKITLSTAGVVAGMKKMIEDKDFPDARFALSLHSAIPEDRKKLIPSQPPDFFNFLTEWSKKYHKRWPSRTHFVGIEYVFIREVNDSQKHLSALISLLSKLGRVRVNLIPYNPAVGHFAGTLLENIKKWQNELMKRGFTVTVRLSQGSDIAAACGQLISR